jgi:hypothetical protein
MQAIGLNKKASALYVTFTPYHVFLATLLAGGRPRQLRQDLIVVADFTDAQFLIKALRTWDENSFTDIRLLPGAYGLRRKGMRQLAYAANIPRIRRSVSKLVVDEIYVFNDARPEAQAALHYGRTKNPNVIVTFVEDGLTAYGSHGRAPGSVFARLGAMALFGRFWEDVTVLGTSRWVNSVRATFPSFVRPELKRYPIRPVVDPSGLPGRLAQHVMRCLGATCFRSEDLGKLEVVVAITQSSVARAVPDYAQAVTQCISDIADAGLRVAVKYHPREPLGDYLNLGQDRRIMQLPKMLPIELIYALAGERLRVVIGDLSNALLTARWLCPRASVLTLAQAFGYVDPPLMETFSKLGIRCLGEAKDLQEAVRREVPSHAWGPQK